MVFVLIGQLLSTDQGVLEVGFGKYNPDFAGTPEQIPIAGATPATHARDGIRKAGEVLSVCLSVWYSTFSSRRKLPFGCP